MGIVRWFVQIYAWVVGMRHCRYSDIIYAGTKLDPCPGPCPGKLNWIRFKCCPGILFDLCPIGLKTNRYSWFHISSRLSNSFYIFGSNIPTSKILVCYVFSFLSDPFQLYWNISQFTFSYNLAHSIEDPYRPSLVHARVHAMSNHQSKWVSCKHQLVGPQLFIYEIRIYIQ